MINKISSGRIFIIGNLTSSIILGLSHFGVFAVMLSVPFLLTQLVRKKFNIVRLGMDYAFLVYSLCLIALVFFPLPTMAGQSALAGHRIQYIPFHFVKDIIDATPFVWNQPQTYIKAFTDNAVLQVVFNVLMTVPFGMYLHYNFHFSAKKVAICSLGLSLFIEIGQLTGLFFIFKGSYRLCDVDDLIANTLGGVTGYAIARVLERFIPEIEAFDKNIGHIFTNSVKRIAAHF